MSETTILFGGDCHFGDKPLRLDRCLRQRIDQAAFLVVNQESPIAEAVSPVGDKEIHLRSSTRATDWLRDLRVQVVSLANNHIADYGPRSLTETQARLRSAGIATVGAGADLSEATSPAEIEGPDGRTIAFLAFTSRSIGSKIAGDRAYGCSELEPVAIEGAVRRARARADHVVLLLHYGLTNFRYPTPKDRELLRSLAGRGVDLIIGHHPHVLQGHEIRDGVPIFYSLGNLVFASYRKLGRVVPLSAENRRGALVAATFGPQGVRFEDIIFTETVETDHGLSLSIPRFSAPRASSFAARSRPLGRASYQAFFKRYALSRLLDRLLLWTSPRRWSTVSAAQFKSFWLSWSYVIGRKK